MGIGFYCKMGYTAPQESLRSGLDKLYKLEISKDALILSNLAA